MTGPATVVLLSGSFPRGTFVHEIFILYNHRRNSFGVTPPASLLARGRRVHYEICAWSLEASSARPEMPLVGNCITSAVTEKLFAASSGFTFAPGQSSPSGPRRSSAVNSGSSFLLLSRCVTLRPLHRENRTHCDKNCHSESFERTHSNTLHSIPTSLEGNLTVS